MWLVIVVMIVNPPLRFDPRNLFHQGALLFAFVFAATSERGRAIIVEWRSWKGSLRPGDRSRKAKRGRSRCPLVERAGSKTTTAAISEREVLGVRMTPLRSRAIEIWARRCHGPLGLFNMTDDRKPQLAEIRDATNPAISSRYSLSSPVEPMALRRYLNQSHETRCAENSITLSVYQCSPKVYLQPTTKLIAAARKRSGSPSCWSIS